MRKLLVNSSLQRIVVKQERRLRRDYEELYIPQRQERGIMPLAYAAWRHNRNERKILEMLLDENEFNRSYSL